MKGFSALTECRIERLTFHRKSTLKFLIKQIIIASLIYYKYNTDQLALNANHASFKIRISKFQVFGHFGKF